MSTYDSNPMSLHYKARAKSWTAFDMPAATWCPHSGVANANAMSGCSSLPTTPEVTSTAAMGTMFICPEPDCFRKFNRRYTLVEHIKTHTGEKPHVCPAAGCHKRFSTSGNLSRHKRLHGFIQPLECPVDGCPSTFASNNKLEKHMQYHLGSPVHVCTIGTCGKTFSTTGNLNRHIKRHHSHVHHAHEAESIRGSLLSTSNSNSRTRSGELPLVSQASSSPIPSSNFSAVEQNTRLYSSQLQPVSPRQLIVSSYPNVNGTRERAGSSSDALLESLATMFGDESMLAPAVMPAPATCVDFSHIPQQHQLHQCHRVPAFSFDPQQHQHQDCTSNIESSNSNYVQQIENHSAVAATTHRESECLPKPDLLDDMIHFHVSNFR